MLRLAIPFLLHRPQTSRSQFAVAGRVEQTDVDDYSLKIAGCSKDNHALDTRHVEMVAAYRVTVVDAGRRR